MKELYAELFTENPVLHHATSKFSRSLRRQSVASQRVALALTIIVYMGLVVSALQMVEFVDASVFLYMSLFVSILATATVLYGSLAGERERRSIDLLLVAPVTTNQIVVAKLARAFWPVLSIVAALTLPSVLFGIVRLTGKLPAVESEAPLVLVIIASIGISMATSLFVAGVTLYLSASNRTTSGALTSTLASLFLIYCFSAFVAASLGWINRGLSDLILTPHPFVALTRVVFRTYDKIPAAWSLVVCIGLHTALGLILVWMAARKLEMERKRGNKPSA